MLLETHDPEEGINTLQPKWVRFPPLEFNSQSQISMQ